MLKNLKSFNPSDVEEDVLDFWKKNKTFEKSLNQRKNAKPFVFFEGPPGANGRPGLHHVLARIYKDVIVRYKTMRGFYVERKGGWDTHGLPVEIAAEKELGFKSKTEIENYGVAKFNELCRKIAWKYIEEWEKATDRMGYWLNMKDSYITYTNDYIESLWWVLKKVDERGLLVQDYKVVPYCARCGTTLSANEVALGYQTVKDKSVYVKFKSEEANTYFLVWTTTPWTLPANVALAINPKLTYVKAKKDGEFLILAKERLAVLGEDAEIKEEFSGEKLLKKNYQPIFSFLKPEKPAHFVVAGDFVSATDGTGIVHIAPAFGVDDMEVGKKNNLPVLITLDLEGKFISAVTPWAGIFAKEADKSIVEELKNRNILFKEESYEHEYPFCWRCSTPLLYYAKKSWFILMSKLRKELVAANQTINWVPEHIKNGRFGDWIKEAKDWAISRERYWGTPLPVWVCDCGEKEVISGLADIKKRSHLNNHYTVMRHGGALFNSKNISASSNNSKNKLTDKGIKEVLRTAKKLKTKKFDLIIYSPFVRTKQTAELVAKELGLSEKKMIANPLLQEINTGIFDGKPNKNYHAYFASIYEKFTKRPPQGENLRDLKKRLKKFIDQTEKKYSGKNILVVSHEYPIWMLDTMMIGMTEDEAAKKKLKLPDYVKTGQSKELPRYKLPLDAQGNLDLHKPYIDEVKFTCSQCGEAMKRIPEVADVWFDSGAMPVAQWHYPFENKEKIDKKNSYPADFISEAIDQTRGWFSTLLSVAILLDYKAPFKNVICLGHVLDKQGKKMSKSRGNAVDAWEMFEKYGADSLRWYLYTINPPGEPKKFDEVDLGKTMRKMVFIVYNSFIFWSTYAAKVSFSKLQPGTKNILDRWIAARLFATTEKVTILMDKYEVGEAAREIESFIDDLSRWYIRRSRRRLQKSGDKKDYLEASATLGWALLELSKLLAPFAPFFAEALYKSIDEKKTSSVHIVDWPKMSQKLADQKILDDMKWAREVVALALAERARVGIKVRQPLAMLKVKGAKRAALDSGILELIKDEVNVKEVGFGAGFEGEIWLDQVITPELKEEGIVREIVRVVQGMRQDAKLSPSDMIKLSFAVASGAGEMIKRNERKISEDVNAAEIALDISGKQILEKEEEIDSEKIKLAIVKVSAKKKR